MSTEAWAHEESQECWCQPELFYTTEDGVQVWVHLDPRVDQPPPPAVLAEAIALAYHDTLEPEKSANVHTLIELLPDSQFGARWQQVGRLATLFVGLALLLMRRQR